MCVPTSTLKSARRGGRESSKPLVVMIGSQFLVPPTVWQHSLAAGPQSTQPRLYFYEDIVGLNNIYTVKRAGLKEINNKSEGRRGPKVGNSE